MKTRAVAYAILSVTVWACGSDDQGPVADMHVDVGIDALAVDMALPETMVVETLVLLDGEPTAGVVVSQGGRTERWSTRADGRVTIRLDTTVEGDLAIVASHPEARIEAAMVWHGVDSVTIELDRFIPDDNPEYEFMHPGMPGHSPTSAYCGHCHVTIAEDFFASRHPYAASNLVLQDIYAGTSAALDTKTTCETAGGTWRMGLSPGTQEATERCYIGDGVLPALNPDCGETESCDDQATGFGGCADCHAPGINGHLGGRDLLEATDIEYERGIHCDVCHHVESIDDEAPAGVAGRLHIVRPSDPPLSPSFDWRPLLFGPHDDTPNPTMGIVQRFVFQESEFCSGCHELEREVLVPSETVDETRWPDGQLPLLSTFSEWEEWGGSITCQGCHMPWDPDVENTADLQLFPSTVGVAGGWYREPPSVRRHIWFGPSSEGAPFRQTAVSLTLESQLADGELTVNATTTNNGPGHGFPTGEPLRSALLLVEATCDDEHLIATGGDAVPDFGGYLDRQEVGSDWANWPGAQPGEVVRVVARSGDFYDYEGFGPFGDGTFDDEARGMPVEQVVGQATIVTVDGDLVTFDRPLPDGDVAYRTLDAHMPTDGDEPVGFAGAAGFGFARVLVGTDGERMVPHYLAVDVASDNRLVAGGSWTSTHQFAATCADPTVTAALLYRRYPLALARQRGWEMTESVILGTN